VTTHFVTFHADFKKRHLDGFTPSYMINLLFRSAALYHTACRKTVLSDRLTDLPGLDHGIEVRRFDIDARKTILSRMIAEIDYLQCHDFSSEIVLLDSDMLVNSSLKELGEKDFDVALTYRKQHELPFKKKELAINGGVIFLKKNRKAQALSFLRQVFQVFQSKYNTEKLWWWGEQYALIHVVGSQNIPSAGEALVNIGENKVLLLPCEEYNFSPPAEYRAIRRELTEKKIIHFKGKRKKLMPFYWDLYMQLREKPGLYSSLRAGLSRLALKIRSTMLSVKPEKKVPHCSHNNAVLQTLIRDQRILILGSGPSASDLNFIPDDVKIFTCNASLRILEEKKIHREIDLLFLIKSKVSKSLIFNNRPAEKTKVIEALMKRHTIKFVATNKPDYAERMKKAEKMNFCCLFDDGRDPYYLNQLLQPDGVESIRGTSPIPWTSSGLRLLQYALFFGAKEIYLIGIDFGHNGYFWGPNPNEWRHTDIDENFVKTVSQKYNHLYSLSKNGALARYLPYQNWKEAEC
jgi:hypothetical protein